MNKSLLIIFLIKFLLPGFSSAQWIHQQSGVSTTEWRNVEFLNENTGYICGYKTILKSTNGGTNWLNLTIPQSDVLYDISIIDSNIVYCAGFYGKIFKSTNGGQNWLSLFSDTLVNVYASHFVNKDTGWFAGARGFPNSTFLIKTTDGGNTFKSQAFSFLFIRDLYFKDANTGLVCGTGVIWKTTNGGDNWYSPNYNFNNVGYSFRRFGIVNNQFCWLIAMSRPVYKSSDFGENWDSISTIPAGNLSVNSTFFINESTGWAGVDFGMIYKTTDGGFNWFDCSTPQPSGFISDMFFINESTGWAVEGNNGNIFKTTNGGCNTVNIIPSNNYFPESNELFQNFPNPFNPETQIIYNIANHGYVKIKVYDINGKHVETLVDSYSSIGKYNVKFNGISLPSGLYFYTLTLDNKLISRRKMLLIK